MFTRKSIGYSICIFEILHSVRLNCVENFIFGFYHVWCLYSELPSRVFCCSIIFILWYNFYLECGILFSNFTYIFTCHIYICNWETYQKSIFWVWYLLKLNSLLNFTVPVGFLVNIVPISTSTDILVYNKVF